MVPFSLNPMQHHAQVSLLAVLSAAVQPAWASDALAEKHACAACHQADCRVVGPAWKDVMARYGDGSVTPAQLAARLKKGSV